MCSRIFGSFVLLMLSSLAAYSQALSTGKATLGDRLESIRAGLGPSYHFETRPLSDPAIVITLANRANQEAYLLESLNGTVFYIEHQVFSETGFNRSDSTAALVAKYGRTQGGIFDNATWLSNSLERVYDCVRYGNNLFTWPGGGMDYLTSVNPHGNCRTAVVYNALRGRAGEVRNMLNGYVFGIEVRLLDPTIAIPEFARLAAEQQRKQQEIENKARQVKAPL